MRIMRICTGHSVGAVAVTLFQVDRQSACVSLPCYTCYSTVLCRGAQTAATALHMGMSVFKKVARSVGISRWPFRKRQSVREIMEMIDKHLVRDADPNPTQSRPKLCPTPNTGFHTNPTDDHLMRKAADDQ